MSPAIWQCSSVNSARTSRSGSSTGASGNARSRSATPACASASTALTRSPASMAVTTRGAAWTAS
eukprot:917506-Prymnesium_polylepis.1